MFGLYSKRKVTREVEHYNLPTILAVGYRVRSHRGTQFHQWVTARLSEYLERKSMTTRQWIEKLDEFLRISGGDLLDHAGTLSAGMATTNR